MITRSIARLTATASAILCATVGHAQQAHLPAAHSELQASIQWTPLLVLFGLVLGVGVLLLVTRQRFRRAPWESDETEAATARGQERRVAEELRTLRRATCHTEKKSRDLPGIGVATALAGPRWDFSSAKTSHQRGPVKSCVRSATAGSNAVLVCTPSS